MSFGDASRWVHPWVLDDGESRRIIGRAIELGVNFFDIANCCSYSASEEFLGRALKGCNRDELAYNASNPQSSINFLS